MKIYFIVERFSSKRDTNGNTYHCARITSTLTGRNVMLRSMDDKNQAYHLTNKYCSELGRDDAVLESNIEKLPKRYLNRLNDVALRAMWAHEFTDLNLALLEQLRTPPSE